MPYSDPQPDKKTNGVMKKIEFYITILIIVVTASIAWATLQARVGYNEREIVENVVSIQSIGGKLDAINNTLNNKDYGLPVLNSRLEQLEK